ncbi:TetR/AcrR family transcriptional regulator [Spongisporangium articulatum]|uniref:TetR/AcrR family transcriptional regulator n=1 Tax=Spongisporangium articulatum TaxID=3362603 RepID=A0ABW8ALW5_9ACTN
MGRDDETDETPEAAARIGSARDRLLTATTQLLEEKAPAEPSTREICARAGVQAPTLYHHFGNKQGLVDEVLNHGFSQYLDDGSGDALDRVRAGWEKHVDFGLDHPAYYALLYGRVREGIPCAITGPALERLTRLFGELAADGRLLTTAQEAAERLLAANVGITLALIAQPPGHRDAQLSLATREAILTSVLAAQDETTGDDAAGARTLLAARLRASLDAGDTELSPGEVALLGELLSKLASSAPGTGPGGPR